MGDVDVRVKTMHNQHMPDTVPSLSIADSRTFSISELAREFGITPRALRFYEDKDMLHPVAAFLPYCTQTQAAPIIQNRGNTDIEVWRGATVDTQFLLQRRQPLCGCGEVHIREINGTLDLIGAVFG